MTYFTRVSGHIHTTEVLCCYIFLTSFNFIFVLEVQESLILQGFCLFFMERSGQRTGKIRTKLWKNTAKKRKNQGRGYGKIRTKLWKNAVNSRKDQDNTGKVWKK